MVVERRCLRRLEGQALNEQHACDVTAQVRALQRVSQVHRSAGAGMQNGAAQLGHCGSGGSCGCTSQEHVCFAKSCGNRSCTLIVFEPPTARRRCWSDRCRRNPSAGYCCGCSTQAARPKCAANPCCQSRDHCAPRRPWCGPRVCRKTRATPVWRPSMPRRAPLHENSMEDDDDVEPPKPQQKKRKRREAKDRTPVMDGQTEEEQVGF